MPRRKSTKPAAHITQVDCGNPYKRTITLIESDIHPGVHIKPKRTEILHASIRLAWNIVFSEHGRKAAAQTLFEKWVSVGGGVIDPDELLAEAVEEVNMFERTHFLTVEVGWMIEELTEVDGEGQSVRIKLDAWEANRAAHAQGMSTRRNASYEERTFRYRHTLYPAILIAHDIQQAIQRADVGPGSLNTKPWPRMIEGRSKTWHYKDATLRSELDKSGCRFEELILGGQLLKITPDLRELIDETFKVGFLTGILGLAIRTKEGNVWGYRTIPDQTIRAIVESGKLPLNQDCFEDFVEAIPSERIYPDGKHGARVFVRELKQVCYYWR